MGSGPWSVGSEAVAQVCVYILSSVRRIKAREPGMSGDVHEIYAIKYGRHERLAADNYIGGDPHDVQEPIDFYVWAITGPHGTFVVDPGFHEATAKKRQRNIIKPAGEGLKALGIAPEGGNNGSVT